MAGRLAALAVVAAIPIAGCGSSEPDPLPAACLDEPAIAEALESAPAPVRLAGGTPLSRCVSLGAGRDGDLQGLGVALMSVADDLRARARTDSQAAVRLGYLISAARRGAARTPGLASQLARRIEQAATFDDAATRAALQRGLAAGERTG